MGDGTGWHIFWIDRYRAAAGLPHPDYPKGIDADCCGDKRPSCVASLPWPAPRCGYYFVKCNYCGTDGLITTAGRPDDPRSLRLACKGGRHDGT